MKFQLKDKIFFCPMQLTMEVLGGKWKLLILWQLQQSTKRYGELRNLIEGITHKMLTQQLRELESDGIVHREVFQVVPPKVEYSLTEAGKQLSGVMVSMSEWASMFQVEEEPLKIQKKKTPKLQKVAPKFELHKGRKKAA